MSFVAKLTRKYEKGDFIFNSTHVFTAQLADLKLQPEKIDQEVNELTEERAELSKRKKETERAMNAVMETLRDDTKHLQKEKEVSDSEAIL